MQEITGYRGCVAPEGCLLGQCMFVCGEVGKCVLMLLYGQCCTFSEISDVKLPVFLVNDVSDMCQNAGVGVCCAL